VPLQKADWPHVVLHLTHLLSGKKDWVALHIQALGCIALNIFKKCY